MGKPPHKVKGRCFCGIDHSRSWRERWRRFSHVGHSYRDMLADRNDRLEAWRPVAEAAQAASGHGGHDGWQMIQYPPVLGLPYPGTRPIKLWCYCGELISDDPLNLPVP